MNETNFTPNLSCYLLSTSALWYNLSNDTNLEEAVSILDENDSILLPRSELFSFILNHDFSAGDSSEVKFFTLKKYGGLFSPRERYYSICGIYRKGSALDKYFNKNSIKSFELKSIYKLLDWSADDDAFFKEAVKLVFGGKMSESMKNRLFPELDKSMDKKTYIIKMLRKHTLSLTY